MYGCGEQEAGVASGSGWNLWVWLLGVVARSIDFLILLIPTLLQSCICSFCSSIPTFQYFSDISDIILVYNILYSAFFTMLLKIKSIHFQK